MVDVRNFNGTSFISLSIGGLNGIHSGACTFALIAKNLMDDTSFREIMGVSTNVSGSGGRSLWRTDSNAVYLDTSGGPTVQAGSWTQSNGWVIIVVTKPAGTSVIRVHKCILSTEVWSHTNSAITSGDAGPNVLNLVRIGSTGWNDDKFIGRIALVGMWKSALSDGAVETLFDSLDNWLSATELLPLTQDATTTPVESLTGTSVQTGITGTTVVTNDDPPLPSGFWEGGSEEHSGGSTALVNVLSSGGGASGYTGGSTASISVDSEGAGSPGLLNGSETEVSISVDGAGSSGFSGGDEAFVAILSDGEGSPGGQGGSEAVVEIVVTGAGQTVPNFTGGSEATVDISTSGLGSVQASGGSTAIVNVVAMSTEIQQIDIWVEVGPTRAGSTLIQNTRAGSVTVGLTRQNRGV